MPQLIASDQYKADALMLHAKVRKSAKFDAFLSYLLSYPHRAPQDS